ncbi:MAG: hypothetical protein KDE59_26370, partial [Anaerolineales bacterium]|nr:hypothetical protein [Anaerolineales bacterium]
PLVQLYRRLSRDERASRLELAPLTTEAIQTIAASLVTGDQAPALAGYLSQESAGNAFVLRELLHELADTYDLNALPWPLPAGWRDGLSRLTDRLRDLVLERVERLPPASQADLGKAAILGSQFDLTLLSAMAPETDLSVTVAQWRERGLVRLDGAALEFAHDKIREVLLESLPAARKTAWHELAAAALRQHLPADSRALAHHLYHGPEPAAALPYLLAGAEAAAHALAYAEVRQLCQQALALTPPTDLQRQFLEWRQLAHQFLGDTAAEGEDALALVTAAQASGDNQQLASAIQRLARFYYLRGEVRAARQAIETVLQAARSAGDLETSVRILDMMAMLFRETVAGQAEALLWQAEALALAQEAGDRRLQGLIQADTAVILGEKGDWGGALAQASAGVSLLRAPDLARYLPHALYIHGGLLRAVGQFPAASAALAEALALCQTHQLQTYLVQVLLEQGELALINGPLPAAEEAFSAILQMARQGGRPLIAARALLGLGQTAYEEGHFARAHDWLAAGLAIDTSERPGLTAALRAALALALLGLDRPVAALPEAAAALATLKAAEHVVADRAQIAWSQIRVWHASGHAATARALQQEATTWLHDEAATLPAEWQSPFLAATPWRRSLLRM